MQEKIVIKVNVAGNKALQSLATAANAAGNGDLENSQNILTILSLIEVDPTLGKPEEKKEKPAEEKKAEEKEANKNK